MELIEHNAPDRLEIKPIDRRIEAGRSLRDDVSLEALAECRSDEGRPDPVAILTNQDTNRQQDLVPIRHGRMGATAFTFYRGAAAIMASDLSATPSTDLRVQLCGDAHLSNFGIFNGADRRLVFDLNDFDETLPGPFDWDVKRLAASITVAGRNNELSASRITKATLAAAKGYRETMTKVMVMNPMDLHYFRLNVDDMTAESDAKTKRRAAATMKKAGKKNSLRALDRLTETVDGKTRIISDPPLIVPLPKTDRSERVESLRDFFGQYIDSLPPHLRLLFQRYRLVDLAQKVVGVGSVGTRCWILLLMSGDGDPLFLQFKEATASVLEPFVGSSHLDHAGARVVHGQKIMQATGDLLLGWARYQDLDGAKADFYFRQLWDGKASVDIDEMGPKRLRRYARFCGAALALAHARSLDPALIAGYLGTDETFDHAMAEFAESYADINERDHAAHEAAIASGRLQAIRDI